MSLPQIYKNHRTILERVETEIYGRTNPIIGAYIIQKGPLRVGMELRTLNGNTIGIVEGILRGTVGSDDPHRYVQDCEPGAKVSVAITSRQQNIDRYIVG
jgi:translation initiation factor IF-2